MKLSQGKGVGVTDKYKMIENAVYEYIILFKYSNCGDSPSYREIISHIADDIGQSMSTSMLRQVLERLQGKGKIRVVNRMGKHSTGSLSIFVEGYSWGKVSNGASNHVRSMGDTAGRAEREKGKAGEPGGPEGRLRGLTWD